MKVPAFVQRRLHWCNLPVVTLVALLQRTPVLRVAASAGEMVMASPLSAVLKSAAALVSLGAVHSLAGATQLDLNPTTVNGTVGTPITPVSFNVNGAPSPAFSYTFSGQLPPGLSIAGISSPTLLNISSGQITGTPTTAGTFNLTVTAWEFTGGAGASISGSVHYTIAGGVPAVAPAFTTSPQSQTVLIGANVTFTVVATGTPTPTIQWRKDGTDINGATNTTLTLAGVTAANAGSYTAVATNSAGTATTTAGVLTVNAAAPTISAQPQTQLVNVGGGVTFSVTATGTPPVTYQWRFNGTAIAGATASSYTIASAQPANEGSYTVVVNDANGSLTSAAAALFVNSGTASSDSRLYAISCRALVGTGSDVLIPGIAVGGGGARQVIVRASGPALIPQGVGGTLARPQLQFYQAGNSTPIATNIGWDSDATQAAALRAAFTQVGIGQFAAGSADCALLAVIESGKAYTAVVSGANGTTGVALVEVYELGASSARMIALSCRARVGTGGDVLIPGIIVQGSGTKKVIIRASGPALAAQGVGGTLAQPLLQLFDGGTRIAQNIGWDSPGSSATAVSAATTAVGLSPFPAGSADCAILASFDAGKAYTAQVSGLNSTTGVALIEVYEVP